MLRILDIAKCSRSLSKNSVIQQARGLTLSNASRERIEKLLPQKDEFQIRHIGPREYEQLEMLKTVGFEVASSYLTYLNIKTIDRTSFRTMTAFAIL